MKGRIWILVFMLAVVMIVGGYATVFRVLQVNRRVTGYLVKRMSRELNGVVNIRSISISPWNVGFHHVAVRLRNLPLTVEADEVRLGFSLMNIIRNRFQPAYGMEELFLHRPKIVWTLAASDSATTSFSMKKIPEISVRKLPYLMVNINNGSFHIVRDGMSLTAAERVSGWLDARSRGSAEMRVEASVLSSGVNTSCTGRFERDGNSGTVDFTSRECDLSRKPLDMLTGALKIERGSLDFSLHLEQREGKLKCEGRYSVNNAVITPGGSGLRVKSISMRGRVNEREILLDSSAGEIDGITPRMEGRLVFFPEPFLTVNAEADAVDLGALLESISPGAGEYPRGTARVKAEVSGSLMDLSIRAECSSGSIAYRGTTIRDVGATVHARGREIVIERLNGTAAGFRFYAGGTLSGDSRRRVRAFSLSLAAHRMRDRAPAYSLRLKGTTDPRRNSYAADFAFIREQASGDPLARVNGTVILNGDQLAFTCLNPFISLHGKAENIFSNPRVESRVNMVRFPLNTYAGLDSTVITADGGGELTGTMESCVFGGDFSVAVGSRVSARLSGKAVCAAPFTRSRTISADARITEFHVLNAPPVDLTVSLRSDSSSTAAFVDTAGETARIFAEVTHTTSALSGKLSLAGFPVEYLIGIFNPDPSGYRGKLTGAAEFAGTLGKPRFATQLPIQAEGLTLGGIERFSGSAKISGGMDELRFSEAEVKRNNTTIARGDGVWTRGNPFVLSVEGRNAEFGTIGDIISTARRCDGMADYSLTMRFTGTSGTVDGAFTVRNGHFLDIPFDEVSAVLGGGSNGFQVNDFRITKSGLYSGTGSASSGYFWKDDTPDPGLKMNLGLKGDLLRVLPYLTGVVRKASGESSLAVTIGGAWQDPVIIGGRLSVSKGMIEPSLLIDRVSDINASLVIDTALNTPSGLRAVRILSASGTVMNNKLVAENVFSGEKRWDTLKKPELRHVVNETVGLDFGVFVGRLEKGGGRERSIELHIPGFLKPKDTARFEFPDEDGGTGDPPGRPYFVVGAAEFEDHLTPYLSGRIRVLSGDINYPLLPRVYAYTRGPLLSTQQGPPSTLDSSALYKIFWDLEISAGSSVYYVNEITKTLNETEYTLPLVRWWGATIARTAAKLDEKSAFTVYGRIADNTFRVTGTASSTSGTVSYVGVEFEIEAVELDLDTDRVEKPALLAARAKTTVRDDSTGVETEIYLKVSTVDRATGKRMEASGRADVPKGTYTELSSELSVMIDAGALGYLQIEFSSSNPADTTRDKILARLGLSSGRFGSAATRALALGMDNYYLDLMRPVEQAIRKYTGLDVVRFTPSVIGNLVRSKLGFLDRFNPDTDYMLFDGSRVMFGEYFMDSFFLSYRGQYGLGRDFLRRKERGFFHELALQYLLKRNTRLQFNYNYDDVIKQSDKRFEIRHDFEF